MKSPTVYLALVLLLQLMLGSCGERDWNSPFDPEGTGKNTWAPQDLSIVQNSEVGLIISWTRSDERITGYQVSRRLGAGEWIEIAAQLDGSSTSYVDQIQQLNVNHRYRVIALADQSGSTPMEIEITPVFATVEITDMETFTSPDSLAIVWAPHEFSSISTYLVQRRGTDPSYQTLDTVNNAYRYVDGDLDTLEAHYQYRILALTEDGLRSDSSGSRSVRFRQVGYRPVWSQADGGRMASSTDGELLYILTNMGELRAIRASNGSVVWRQTGTNYSDFELSPDGTRIIAGGYNDVALRLLYAETGALIWRQYNASFDRPSLQVGFSPSGNFILDSYNLRLRKMDLAQSILWTSNQIGTAWTWSPDESKILFWGRYNNPNVGILDANDMTLLWQDGTESLQDSVPSEYIYVLGMGWHGSSGNYWMCGSREESGWVKYFTGNSNDLQWEINFTDAVTPVTVPDGNDLYVTTMLQSLSKIDLSTGERLWEIPAVARAADYLPSTKIIAAVTNGDNVLSIIDTESGTVVYSLPQPSYAQNAHFSPDGSHLYLHLGDLWAFDRFGLWTLDPINP